MTPDEARKPVGRTSARLPDAEGGLKPALLPDDSPGVPLFRTWRGVYLFIFGAFVTMVIALTLFARHYG